jgi:hypothetical protein
VSLIKQVLAEHHDWLRTPQSRHRLVLELIRKLALLDFGYRLRPEMATSFDTLSTLLSAMMRGLVITALSTPEVASHRTVATPFGASDENSWSLPATGMAGIAMAFLEPDPTTEWNDERLAQVHRALDAWTTPAP